MPFLFSECDDKDSALDNNSQDAPSKSDVKFCDSIGENWKVSQRAFDAIPLVLSSKEQEAVNRSNAFANKLLSKLLESDSNVVVSPVSLQIALGMVMNGLSAKNMEQTKQAIGLGDLSLHELNSFYSKLSTSLNSNLDSTSCFETQNSIWSNFSPLMQSYVNTVSDSYQASIANLDFRSDNAPEIINAWAKEATRGLIEKLVTKEDLYDQDILLANACYFKADWKRRFMGSSPSEFFDENGNLVASKASLMTIEETLDIAYECTNSYQAVRLPYGNGSFYMDVILPNNTTCAELVENFDWNALNLSKDFGTTEFMGYTVPVRFNLYMPKFVASNKFELTGVLKELGLTKVFSTSLEEMNGSIFLDKCFQVSKIEVDEEGTKAAAITEFFGIKIGESAPSVSMVCNRPFFYAIREAKTGLILFMGKVSKPELMGEK